MWEEKIDRWIADHKEELLADIGELVAIPSVSQPGPEPKVYGEASAAALEAMLALGEKYGFAVSNAEYRCGVIEGERMNGGRTVGIWGHVDVVPAGNHWTYPPFQATLKGDFLIGRGVQDNKGPAVAVLYAMRCIRELGIPLRYTLKQIVGSSEEAGMDDATYFVEHGDVPDFNIVADSGFPVCYGEKGIIEAELRTAGWSGGSGAVLGFRAGSASNIVPGDAELTLRLDARRAAKLAEAALPAGVSVEVESPNGGLVKLLDRESLSDGLTVGHKRVEGAEAGGYDGAIVRLTAVGKSGHAGFPEGSVNAIGLLLDAVLDAGLLDGDGEDERLLRFICGVCSSNDGSALGIACRDELSGPLTCVGAVGSLQDGELCLEVNIRYPITADPDEILRGAGEAASEGGFALAHVHVNKANRGDKDAPEVRLLTDTYNRVTGGQAEPFVMGGGTYARKIPNAVAFGPGMPADLAPLGLPPGHGGVHAPDEAQSVPNLLTALKIYVLSFIALNETA
ncbi:M20/M25/M40 family metallo-hydrolase [Paenibacillus sp. NPDC058071]|uniref:M20/M25/M40 family metallo-hydrolase n=1 Tax=Paenibacillus sp. NPDC058071 TaxID=3346326 RepID=UPI0036DAE2D7